ncbi:hypothetical protein [Martelella sp. FOR1707]
MAGLKLSRRAFVGASLAAPFVLRAGGAAAETTVKFSFAAPFDGSNAAGSVALN